VSTHSSSPASASWRSAAAELLAERLAERIRREGPIPFADFMEAALYDERDGFFARGAGAGRAGSDFVTSPEVGTLFGSFVARAIDDMWRDFDEPDPFVVVEAGAGRGRLAADVLRAEPACTRALRYVLVERSAALRQQQRELLELEPADEALGPAVASGDRDDAPVPIRGVGPIVTSLDELPAIELDPGLVLANELLDNFPVRIVERAGEGWSEVRVTAHDDMTFGEVLVPAPPDLAREADLVAAGARVAPGTRLPVPTAARDWLRDVAKLLRHGEAIVVDYADDAAGLVARGPGAWLRTYRGHERGTSPLDAPGTQDITCDVPLEYLRGSAEHAGFTVTLDVTQRAWLLALGLEDVVEASAAHWRERAAIGDLDAVAARSRVIEADALTDRAGLGAHRVIALRR